MASPHGRSALQRDARELARTAPADPYRGALTDPFAPVPPPQPRPAEPAAEAGPPRGPGEFQTPGQATLAGILAIALALTVGLFGMLLLALLGLQNDYGAPDRSYYRGTDSGYLVLALIDFGLAVCCAIGGISFMTGRLGGRIAVTVAGWGILLQSAFWLIRGEVNHVAPLIVGVAAAVMLVLSYQSRVTRWLGVLPTPQPE